MNDLSDGGRCISVVDPSQAHSGRVHDFLLGGKDHYMSDWKLGQALRAECPDFAKVVTDVRAFLLRAVRSAVEAGVLQFLELGCGYPCSPNVHEVVTAVAPDSYTLYVDSDPVVVVHQQAMLSKIAGADIVCADLTDTGRILKELESRMDLGAPVAISLSFVLELIADPSVVVETLVGALSPGSHVVISHLGCDSGAELAVRAAEIYGMHGIEVFPRTRAAIAELLGDCGLVELEPGIVPPHRWRSSIAEVNHMQRRSSTATTYLSEEWSCYTVVGLVV
ncbi:SAM-dependent methyltransferase [Nocardia vinacea]|uniref:SAM-dependent methyltransferase n=1 Tax=Nocardia vinacea TaxID=96468 RepID=UPI002E0FA94C|nr:SAM-dependent methyltransferase [Nocardia vinacea]